MPRKDGTGPDGKGPKTGRGDGPCKPDDQAGSDSDSGQGRRGSRRGSKRGSRRGGGRGRS